MESTRYFSFTTLLFIGVLGAGIVLRFWRWGELPLTHDELSTLYRANYNTFNELIEQGVKPDGHPPALQFFVWVWTRIFGFATKTVKLPFVLMGIASIIWVYKIGKEAFGETSALLAAVCMATLQYPLVHGAQIARMYALGGFTLLGMAYYWLQLLRTPTRKDYVLFIFLGSITCYTHHFALLVVGIACISGLLFIPKERKIYFLLSILAIGVLYLPNLRIFFLQLSYGGVTWLSVPTLDFFRYYFSYIFHFSYTLWAVVLLIVGIGQTKWIRMDGESPRKGGTLRWIFFGWFAIPIALGYLYSVYRSPVMHHQSLYFGFPFGLLFLFSFCQNWKKAPLALATLLLMGLNIYTLVEREHFYTLYHQPYPETAQIGKEMRATFGKDIFPLFNLNPQYLLYYDSTQSIHYAYFGTYAKDKQEYRKKIAAQPETFLMLAEVPRDFYRIAKEFYPYEWAKKEGFTYEIHILSRIPDTIPAINDVYLQDGITCPTNHHECKIELNIPEELPYSSTWIESSVLSNEQGEIAGEFILEILENGRVIHTQSWQLHETTTPLQRHYFSERLRHTMGYAHSRKNLAARIRFISTTPHTQAAGLELKLTQGNKWVYGLTHEI